MAGVQFNLLPDVKLNYIKAQRSKSLIVTVALIASGAAIVLFLVVLLTVEGVQKKQLSDSQKDINTASDELKNTDNLSEILTVQNQLQTLSGLHHNKHITSRIYTYLPQVTPANAYITSLGLDTTTNTMAITGTADNQTTVNTFIDTLKFTTFKVGAQDSDHQAFPSVVETTFSISNGAVNYGLSVTYDPTLFSNNVPTVPTLTVPKLTTTRSVTEDPSNALFNGQSGSAAPAAKPAGAQ